MRRTEDIKGKMALFALVIFVTGVGLSFRYGQNIMDMIKGNESFLGSIVTLILFVATVILFVLIIFTKDDKWDNEELKNNRLKLSKTKKIVIFNTLISIDFKYKQKQKQHVKNKNFSGTQLQGNSH